MCRKSIQPAFISSHQSKVETSTRATAEKSTSKSEACQVNADYFFRLWGRCALRICPMRLDDQQRILRWSSEKIAWCYEKKTIAFLDKQWLASSPRSCASAFIEPHAAIFGETQDCTASPASVQSRHSFLRLLDVPKIENGARRKAVRRHRDDSEQCDARAEGHSKICVRGLL